MKADGRLSRSVTVYTDEGIPLATNISPRAERETHDLSKACFNLVNLVVGNALVALPFAMNAAGLALGIGIIVVVAALSSFVTYYFVLAGRKCRRLSFEGLTGFVFGTPGWLLALLIMFLNELGSMVARLVLLGDMVGPLHRTWFPHVGRRMMVIVACCCVVLPLSMLRNLESLRYSSLFSVVSNIAVIGLLLTTAGQLGNHPAINIQPGQDPLLCFGLVAFLFANQEFSFSIFASSGALHRHRWRKIVCVSNIVAACICMLMGTAGILAFGNDVQPDVMDNFDDYDVVANIARCFVALIVLSGFPLDLFVTRHVACRLLGYDGAEGVGSVALMALTGVIFTGTLAVGANISNLGLVQAIVGSVCGVLICFIIPPLCILYANKITDGKWFVSKKDLLFPGIVAIGIYAGYKGILNAMEYDL